MVNHWSDERQRNGENRPRPEGLRRKSGHTSLSPLCLEQPNPVDSASSPPHGPKISPWGPRSDRISARNAIHPSSVNRP